MSRLSTPLCTLFGIEYPIVQTGMGWVAGARLTAATSEAGGLGILAAATMTQEQLIEQIQEVKSRTAKPFGVNLRGDQPDLPQRLVLLAREGVKVASFARAPGPKAITQLKEAGILTMPTIGAPRHAEKVVAMGIDALIAQGGEGGGHTGAIPTSLLLPEVTRAVRVPVLAAGGFCDGRGLVAALAWGAQGIAMGTRFLLTQESTVPDAIKARYLQTDLAGTVVTTAVDGHPQRVVRTHRIDALENAGFFGRLWMAIRQGLALSKVTGARFFDLVQEARAMKQHSELTWPQVAMAANAPMLTRASLVAGDIDAGILPTGQVVGRLRLKSPQELPTVAQVIQACVAEAESTLDRLQQLAGTAAVLPESTPSISSSNLLLETR